MKVPTHCFFFNYLLLYNLLNIIIINTHIHTRFSVFFVVLLWENKKEWTEDE